MWFPSDEVLGSGRPVVSTSEQADRSRVDKEIVLFRQDESVQHREEKSKLGQRGREMNLFMAGRMG